MMRADAFPITQIERHLVPQVNSVIAVIDRPAELRSLRDFVIAAGISDERLEIHSNANSFQWSERSDSQSALTATLARWLGAIASAVNLSPSHARAYQDGRMLAVIRGINRTEAKQLRGILGILGACSIQHYGRFSVALLSP